jgi:uncharacterized metal-binding protein
MSATILRPLPVLVACAGCPAHGDVAREAGAELDRAGKGELSWLGAADLDAIASKARSRWPVYALDACADGCARRWLERAGVQPQRCYVLEPVTLPQL